MAPAEPARIRFRPAVAGLVHELLRGDLDRVFNRFREPDPVKYRKDPQDPAVFRQDLADPVPDAEKIVEEGPAPWNFNVLIEPPVKPEKFREEHVGIDREGRESVLL